MTSKLRPLSDEAIVMIARRFGLLSEPLRIRLLHALHDGEQNVGALVERSGGSQTNVSRHLQALADAGIVSRRKAGLQVFYTISDSSIFDLCDLVCGSLEKQHRARAALLSRRAGR